LRKKGGRKKKKKGVREGEKERIGGLGRKSGGRRRVTGTRTWGGKGDRKRRVGIGKGKGEGEEGTIKASRGA